MNYKAQASSGLKCMDNTLREQHSLQRSNSPRTPAEWTALPASRPVWRKAYGFTIAELMIATAVFSVVLLVALAGFLDIGHLFYKGVTTTQTGGTANQIFTDLTGNFQTATNVTNAQSANGYTYYCIGNSRYTYNIGQRVTSVAASHASPSSGGNFGLLKDTLAGTNNACATPCDDINTGNSCPSGAVRLNNPTELLGDQMRLEQFSIQPNAGVSLNFYNVSIIIAYGDDSVLNYTTQGDPTTVYCAGKTNIQEFCSVSKLDTGVYRGSP